MTNTATILLLIKKNLVKPTFKKSLNGTIIQAITPQIIQIIVDPQYKDAAVESCTLRDLTNDQVIISTITDNHGCDREAEIIEEWTLDSVNNILKTNIIGKFLNVNAIRLDCKFVNCPDKCPPVS